MSSIVKFNKDSHFQRIQASYVDDKIKLSEFEEQMLERMKFVFSLRLKNKYSKQQAVSKLESEYKVSRATAYRDYASASMLFGEIDDVDARGEKMVLREQYWYLYQQNIKERNWQEAKRALDSYRELFDFSDTSGDVDPDKIAKHVYNIKVSKKVEKALLNTLKDGVIDLNSFNPNAEDIDFEEVKKNDQG